jgi:Ca2+-binding EF-hand superfamily protein
MKRNRIWKATVLTTLGLLLIAGATLAQPGGGPGRGRRHGGPPPIDRIFERFDANKDGRLTQDELPAQVAERIMEADADGDGAVTKEELEQARQKLGDRFLDRLFERFDANADGKLTPDEVPPRLADRLMKADADGDGGVTKDELRAALRERRT